MNPIEKAYSKLKAYSRKIAERTVAGLMRALETCADIFKPAECESTSMPADIIRLIGSALSLIQHHHSSSHHPASIAEQSSHGYFKAILSVWSRHDAYDYVTVPVGVRRQGRSHAGAICAHKPSGLGVALGRKSYPAFFESTR